MVAVKKRLVLLSCLSASLCFWSSVAQSEVLVTVDGQRIEIQGPWQEKGRLIVYTDATGNLASIRTSAVDLDASRRASKPPAPLSAEGVRPAREATRLDIRSGFEGFSRAAAERYLRDEFNRRAGPEVWDFLNAVAGRGFLEMLVDGLAQEANLYMEFDPSLDRNLERFLALDERLFARFDSYVPTVQEPLVRAAFAQFLQEARQEWEALRRDPRAYRRQLEQSMLDLGIGGRWN